MEAHYADVHGELVQCGMQECEIEECVRERLGTPEDIAARMNAVHNSASWTSALLAVLPFVASSAVRLFPQASTPRIGFVAALLAVTASFSIRELLLGRRPVWLSAWLAACGLCAISLIQYAVASLYDTSWAGLAASALVVSFVTLVVVWRLRPWRKIVLGISAVAVPSGMHLALTWPSDSANFFAVLGAYLATVAMLVIFAVASLEKHAYGNAFRASLFLLSVFVLRYPLMSTTAASAVLPLILVIPIVWAVRNPRFESKNLGLRAAVLLHSLMWALGTDEFPGLAIGKLLGWSLGLAFTSLMYYTFLAWPIMWPMGVDQRRREEQRRAIIEGLTPSNGSPT